MRHQEDCQLAAMVFSTDCACAAVIDWGVPALLVKAAIAVTSCCTREASSTAPSLSSTVLSWFDELLYHPLMRTLSVLPVPRTVTTRSLPLWENQRSSSVMPAPNSRRSAAPLSPL